MTTQGNPFYYDEMAKELVNNHAKFESFGWHDGPEDREEWCIVHTHNRDSGLLAQANAQVIAKRLAAFVKKGTVLAQHFGHWLCGWVDGYAIRVYKRNLPTDKRSGLGAYTAAFKVWCDITAELEGYPVLDDDLYNNMQTEAARESIKDNAPTLINPPENWVDRVFKYLWDRHQEVLEVREGSVYVDEETIRTAIVNINPLWLDYPFGDSPPEEYEAICEHIDKADKDLAEYCKLVPHAAAKATEDIARLKKKLEAKRRRFIRDYYAGKQ